MKKNSKRTKNTKLANPVTSLANKIATLFDGCDCVTTKFYFNKSTLRIICDTSEDAYYLASICKSHFDLGNLFLDVQFCYLDGRGRAKQVKNVDPITDPAVFAAAFHLSFGKCPVYGGVVDIEDPFHITWYYLLGSKMVCQYDNDDTRNPWGVTSCLPEEIFAEFLNIPNGVKVSTEFVDPN